MAFMKLKSYQAEVLATLRRFLAKTVELEDAGTAFYAITRRPYLEVPALAQVPYVCLRVPTGGGKTILAAHTPAIAADVFLRTDAPVVLWLVPSQVIRDQTLRTLRDRSHPNRRAMAERFGENVRVLTVADALHARRAEYDGTAVVVVATVQAFRVDDVEGRKVYEPNGELMDHFGGVGAPLRPGLETGPDQEPVFSLANVLRLRRPLVIVDEAHNVRTTLSFEAIARLAPSLIVEFTATPVRPADHAPAKGMHASNILHEASAAELKAAEMIKLPVVLRGRPDPRDTIGDAIAWLDHLAAIAAAEEERTGEHVRPIMLLQAEPKLRDTPTLHAEAVRELLTSDFLVPPEQVAVATGDVRELDRLDLLDRRCPIRFVITQQALREGWDCPFAYVLCSVAHQRSARAVEQLLGRVLRLPNAKRKGHPDLNRAYAFATTTSFQDAAKSIQDGLVANGFERSEARSLVHVIPPPGFDDGSVESHDERIPEAIDIRSLVAAVEELRTDRIRVDPIGRRLTVSGALTGHERVELARLMPAAEPLLDRIAERIRRAQGTPRPEPMATTVSVPRLAVRRNGVPEPFDRAHFLDGSWPLDEEDARDVLRVFAPPRAEGEEAHLDVSGSGRVMVEFMTDLHAQLSLSLTDRTWTKAALVDWIDRRLPLSTRRDVTRAASTLFVANAVEALATGLSMSLEEVARARFRVVDAIVRTIDAHRTRRERDAFSRALLPRSGLRFETGPDLVLELLEEGYAYSVPYRGRTTFRKHLFPIVGDLDPDGEEHDCAVHLDRSTRVAAWVRNTVRQPNSFWLQTSTDRFYPDFLAVLDDGRIVAVEYKGGHLASGEDAREKLLVGRLWAESSGGRCVFVMISGREFSALDVAIRDTTDAQTV